MERRGGVHDAAAAKWANLADADGYVTTSSGWVWNAKSVIPEQKAKSGQIQKSYGPLTTEVVMKFDNSKKSAYVIVSFDTAFVAHWIGVRANNTVNFANTAYYCNAIDNELAAYSWAQTGNHYAQGTIWKNGIDATVLQAGMNWGNTYPLQQFYPVSTGNGFSFTEIYCIRLYSKRLSDDERIANYAVDRKRFNLP